MEIGIFNLVLLCFLTFLAGFIDSIAGGGGLISVPAYIMAGIPVHLALGSGKFSSSFGTLIATINYWRHNKVHVRTAAISFVFAFAGSAAGAKTVLYVDDTVFRIMLIVLIPLIALFITLKKDFGSLNATESLKPMSASLISAAIGLVIGFYDGFIGPGTGTFLIFAYTLLLHFDLVTASGNAKLVNLASNVGAMLTFLLHGQVLFAVAIPAALTGIAGNYIGSRLALEKGSKVIRAVFMVVLGLMVINLILSVRQ